MPDENDQSTESGDGIVAEAGKQLRDRTRFIEATSTVLLSVAVILSAWAGYQASRWSGEQAIAFSAANAARVESTRVSTEAGQLQQVDIGSFLAYAQAYSENNKVLTDFLYQRFRPPMKVAMTAWLATRPLTNPDAPPTPFAMPEYQLPEKAQAQVLLVQASEQTALAKTNNQRSDNYVLTVVLFASVLFFAGISTKVDNDLGQRVLLTMGWLILLGTAAWLATFPISFSIS
jgi:hypothetical protein